MRSIDDLLANHLTFEHILAALDEVRTPLRAAEANKTIGAPVFTVGSKYVELDLERLFLRREYNVMDHSMLSRMTEWVIEQFSKRSSANVYESVASKYPGLYDRIKNAEELQVVMHDEIADLPRAVRRYR